jgi:ParB-like nuclease domain
MARYPFISPNRQAASLAAPHLEEPSPPHVAPSAVEEAIMSASTAPIAGSPRRTALSEGPRRARHALREHPGRRLAPGDRGEGRAPDSGALYELIAGQRRLEAVKRLGWTEVPVHIVNLDDILRGEFAENEFRKDLTESEKAAVAEALRPKFEAAAKKRKEVVKS